MGVFLVRAAFHGAGLSARALSEMVVSAQRSAFAGLRRSGSDGCVRPRSALYPVAGTRWRGLFGHEQVWVRCDVYPGDGNVMFWGGRRAHLGLFFSAGHQAGRGRSVAVVPVSWRGEAGGWMARSPLRIGAELRVSGRCPEGWACPVVEGLLGSHHWWLGAGGPQGIGSCR